ncbi:DUF2281 domain-containing protein [Anabaena cylindrica UHCC 0172]|uniref:DUF2281 domain-containing protein n=1 Tax=Anabaena cylindrica TaxID=1165 RepID=UPI002B1FF012|nr:DUF2281 domain-containing protein [Anabaena cylindrica]MEA5551728.1 DUF2281 domain-containing protein [Anabaena cylindrica UHCC 0172]
MTQAIDKKETLLDNLLETLQKLTPKQQKEVLEFIEFLQYKQQKQEVKEDSEPVISAYEAAKEFAGCVESGIGDLSYNKKYLEVSSFK